MGANSTAITGYNVVLKLDSSIFAGATDYSFKMNNKVIEYKDINNLFTQYKSNGYDVEITCNGWMPRTKDSSTSFVYFDAMVTKAMTPDASLTASLMPTVAGLPYYEFPAIIINPGFDAGEDVVKTSFTVKGIGQVTAKTSS